MQRTITALLLLAGCGRWGFDNGERVDTDGPDGTIDADGTDGSDGAPVDAAGLDAFVEPNLVFITSTTIAPTAIAPLTNADAMCQARAVAGGLPGTYVAWVSTTAEPARTRLRGARGWVRLDGLPFADRIEDLTAGRVWYPVAFDENQTAVGGGVIITGTAPDGTAGFNCADWTDTAGSTAVGTGGGGAQAWTSVFGQIALCNQSLPLLCFGVDRTARVEPPAEKGRLAFISSAPWTPAGGIATADARCALDANAEGYTGTFKALLATTSGGAFSRFETSTRALWVRPDGVRVAESFEQITAGGLLAPIDVAADGTPIDDKLVWGGANGVTASSTLADNCSDWSTTTGSAIIGRAGRAGLWGASTAGCATSDVWFYCLED